MIGVSVIICCYNSSTRIIDTLNHLKNQEIPPHINWEIILVDNASNDDTSLVATNFWQNCVIPFKIVFEPTAGLSYAREKGIKEAKYEYLLFCDDDNWLNPRYIKTAFDIIDGNNLIGALGGYGIPEFEVKPNRWIKKYQGIYATGKQAEISGETSSIMVYGAGCINRKSAILNLFDNGFKYFLTGRKGSQLLVGEDHELCLALALTGYLIWFDERLTFQHFIPKSRSTIAYLEKNIQSIARSYFYINIYKILLKNKDNKKYKSSWLWTSINRLRFIFKDFSNYLMNKKDNDPLSSVILISNLKSFFFLLVNARKYNEIKASIEKSNWYLQKHIVNKIEKYN